MIGIFDSGVGGLSVLRHIRTLLPHEDLLYLADQAHVPYGPRSQAQIRRFSDSITRFLHRQGADLIVVACNTAAAAALTPLRHTFPHLRFVGMEPAVKPAAAQTRTGKVGVMATVGTFTSPRYADLMHRFAGGIEVIEDPCPGLVDLIEAGQIDTPETKRLLQQILRPMLDAGVDTIVLGCTHYPFVRPLIEQITGTAVPHPVTIIDPAPAVARQTQRVRRRRPIPHQSGHVRLLTTGPPDDLHALLPRLLGRAYPVAAAVWKGDVLTLG